MITRKVKVDVFPADNKEEKNKAYKYIRDGQEAESIIRNEYISSLYVEERLKASKDNRKELHKLYGRIPNSKKGSAYNPSMEMPKGFMIGSIQQEVEADFKKALKQGLMYGKVSLPSYRKNNPLSVHNQYCNLRDIVHEKTGRNTGIYHNYDSHEEFIDHLYKKDIEILWQFVNDIKFKLDLGDNLKKSHEIRTVFQKIFEGEYTIHGSKIVLQKRKDGSGDDIYLLLSIDVPPTKMYLDENVVVGVDRGINIPAYCALNTNSYIRSAIGDGKMIYDKRAALKAEKDRIKRISTFAKGGHGRNRKMVKFDKIAKHEQAVMKHIDHCIAKKVVQFAVKNHAKYINLEDLSGINKDDKYLKDWSFYRQGEFIKYKAAKVGIIVREVDPKYTSQTCSCCGNLEDGQRIDQAHFVCKKCGEKMNADFNAARNIAMSTKFITEEDKKKKKKIRNNKDNKSNV